MNIVLPEHRSLEEVVALVILMGRQGADREQVQRALVDNVGISDDDAALAWDRVHGGIVRAATGNASNCPNRAKDALAWLSFQRAREDRSIIAALYPQYAPRASAYCPNYAKTAATSDPRNDDAASTKPWWKFW